jgi:hypothetical protein
MIKQDVFQLDGKDVVINKWSTTDQIRYMPILGPVFATPVSLIADGQMSKSDDTIAKAMQAMFFSMSDTGNEDFPTFNDIVDRILLSGVHVSNSPCNSDSFDDIDDVIYVCARVINLNYGKLLEGKGFTELARNWADLARSQMPSDNY